MLIVKSSVSGSTSVPYPGASPSVSSRSIVTDCSRSRYGTSSGSRETPVAGASGAPLFGSSLIPARHLVLVEGEQDLLAAHREVAALRVSLVVLGHEDPAQVGMAVEAPPNMSKTSRSWKSAPGKRSTTVGTTGSSTPRRV